MKLQKVSIIFFLLSSFIWSNPVKSSGCIEAQGPTIEKNQALKPFQAIKLNFKANVTIEQSDQFAIVIKAQRQIHDYINPRIIGNKLTLNLDTAVCRSKPINIHINTQKIKTITLNGSGHIESSNTLETNELIMNLNGSGSMNFRVINKKTHSNINGSGAIELSGKSNKHLIKMNGAGTLEGFYLTAKEVEVKNKGSGTINIYVSDSLKADIKGSGIIRYKGGPEIKTQIKGTGFVSPTR